MECVIFDFDGTLTDSTVEAERFVLLYRQELGQLVGLSDIADRWERSRQAILARPADFGWTFEGRIVAPAHTDAYVLASRTAHLLLDEAGLLSDGQERLAVLQRLFRENYRRVEPVFRAETKEVLEQLLASTLAVCIVTNSSTEVVEGRLEGLDLVGRERLRVVGNARKYVVCSGPPADRALAELPAQVWVEGLARPVFLHRGDYFAALQAVWSELSVAPEDCLVCGDVYELDLALPAALGAAVALVARASTASYEEVAVARHARGSVHQDLRSVVGRPDLRQRVSRGLSSGSST